MAEEDNTPKEPNMGNPLANLDEETQQKIQELQILEQSFQQFLMQKNAFSMEANETDYIIQEVEKSEGEISRIIGNQVVVKSTKEKILEEMKQELTPRKYSYLTAVRADVEEEDVINLIVDKENEFLFEELKKSDEIIDLLKSIIAKMMGLEIIVKVTLSLDTKKNIQEKGLSVAQEIFDVEDLT